MAAILKRRVMLLALQAEVERAREARWRAILGRDVRPGNLLEAASGR